MAFKRHVKHRLQVLSPHSVREVCTGCEDGRCGGGGEEAQVQHEPLPERGRGPPRPPGDEDDDNDDDDDNYHHLQSIQSLVANMTFSAD